jgi:hypothetical protein
LARAFLGKASANKRENPPPRNVIRPSSHDAKNADDLNSKLNGTTPDHTIQCNDEIHHKSLIGKPLVLCQK